MKNRRLLWFIIILTLVSLYVSLPGVIPVKFSFRNFSIDKEIKRPALNWEAGSFSLKRDLEIKKGIDLAGGAHLVFQANMSEVKKEDQKAAIEASRDNIEKRVNLFGVTEPVIQTSKVGDDYRLIVELAGVEDINTAVDLIGQTAQLDFRELEEEATTAANIFDFKHTGLTGKDLTKAEVKFDPNTGQPTVGLIFSSEGGTKFSEITERNINKQVAIFLDEFPVTAPTVQEKITTGEAIISGEFTVEEAKQLVIQLNAGALPVPIKLIEQRNIGATLGADSVQKSVNAGLIGLLMVIVFMVLYYGKLGVLASLALIVYGLVTLTIYKLIPVTLTLPGVAGFILSVGMAVDANILIFERMKEEIRDGKPRAMAMELGFGRAWDSIRDANVVTLITCFILFNPFNWPFLNSSGMVRGFALTLGLGVILSLFTGIVVTRTLLRVFIKAEVKK